MRQISFRVASLVLTIAAAAAAQGPGPGGPGPSGNRPGSPADHAGLNMAAVQVVQGTITSVQIALGAQYPAIVVDGKSIKVAPAWYLLDNDFELSAGVAVKVTMAPSLRSNDPYMYAIDVTKTASGASIVLRSTAGIPLWTGARRAGGNQAAPRTGTGCIDAASISTVTGTLQQVTAGLGIQHPEMVLSVNGSLMTFKLGPEWVLFDSDVELMVGETLTVRYAAALCVEELLALRITDSEGNTVVLRHDDGTPAWRD